MWRYFGYARTDPSHPTAAGICDRCNMVWQLSELKFQHQWRGQNLQNTWFRVCPRCLDKPSEFLKAILLPADPVPVQYPRPDQNQQQMNNNNPTGNWDTLNSRWDSEQGSGNPTYWDGA